MALRRLPTLLDPCALSADQVPRTHSYAAHLRAADVIAKLGCGPFTYQWVHRPCAMEHLVTLGLL